MSETDRLVWRMGITETLLLVALFLAAFCTDVKGLRRLHNVACWALVLDILAFLGTIGWGTWS